MTFLPFANTQFQVFTVFLDFLGCYASGLILMLLIFLLSIELQSKLPARVKITQIGRL